MLTLCSPPLAVQMLSPIAVTETAEVGTGWGGGRPTRSAAGGARLYNLRLPTEGLRQGHGRPVCWPAPGLKGYRPCRRPHQITNMSELFRDMTHFNENISKWDVANVEDMSFMFYGATSFNMPLGAWNTSSVTDVNRMFYNAAVFDQDMGGLAFCAEQILLWG